ncbi:hypothetical protein DES49_1538 [Halospina denitrificans]|uniref:Alpha-tubulin suppressor-like RCC1 family protein n=1 Tax=Halospina denitrificans TaxID=332522 RepID=A0A4R7JT66_9GAMM|nr:hypothetical protein [Halospina denitrificans]TDT41450.1 hypothetical protein DES49_1538 [Halospina denitrificans]
MKRMTRLVGALIAASLLLSACTVIEADTQYQGPGLERHKGSVQTGALYMVQDDGTVLRYGPGNGYIRLTGPREDGVFKVPGLENIEGIEVGTMHALALDREGCIWAWGRNKYDPLGFQPNSEIEQPTRYDELCHIKDFDAESYFSIVLHENNTIRFWGVEVPGNVKGKPLSIEDSIERVYAGGLFFAVSESGKVYAWGRSSHHSVFSSGAKDQWKPELLDIPCSVKGVNYSPGAVFVCDNGDVYVFGRNGAGFLGTGDRAPRKQIEKHPYLSGVEKVEGGSIRIAKLMNNQYVGWGDQIIAPIEASNQGYMVEPIRIDAPEGTIDFYSSRRSIYFINEDGSVAKLVPEEHWFWPYKYLLEDYHFRFYK